MFLLDSNVYIAGFNDPEFGEAFRAFHQKNLPRLVLSAVVAHELLVGARDRRRIDALERGLIEPFRTRRRIHVPTQATWNLAADIDRGLRELGGYDSSLAQRSAALGPEDERRVHIGEDWAAKAQALPATAAGLASGMPLVFLGMSALLMAAAVVGRRRQLAS